MNLFQTALLIYLSLSVLATLVVYAACATAWRSEQIELMSNDYAPHRAAAGRRHPSRCLRSEAMRQAMVMVEGRAEALASNRTATRPDRQGAG
jgi:hypothetical protein